MEQYSVDRSQSGQSLGDFISSVLSCSKKQAKRIIDSRRVFVNRQRIWIASHRLKSGDKVELPDMPKPVPTENTKIKPLYKDQSYFVLNKPAGILSNGKNSFEVKVRSALNMPTITAVHRLDQDTSGCLIFATNKEAFDKIVTEFKANKIEKIYLALVKGRPSFSSRTINRPIDGKSAVTHFIVKELYNQGALLEARLETGRMHQIRVHLQELGFPILGDNKYGNMQELDQSLRAIPRQMLHAYQISFKHPYSQKHVTAKSPIPLDFKECMRLLHS